MAGLKPGDEIAFEINGSGRLELLPVLEKHRRIKPAKRVAVEELFKKYTGPSLDNRDAWPDETLLGAEWEAWER